MKLVTLKVFRTARFFDPSSIPPQSTARRWCEQHKIPAKKIGGTWYVDAEEFQRDDDDALLAQVIGG